MPILPKVRHIKSRESWNMIGGNAFFVVQEKATVGPRTQTFFVRTHSSDKFQFRIVAERTASAMVVAVADTKSAIMDDWEIIRDHTRDWAKNPPKLATLDWNVFAKSLVGSAEEAENGESDSEDYSPPPPVVVIPFEPHEMAFGRVVVSLYPLVQEVIATCRWADAYRSLLYAYLLFIFYWKCYFVPEAIAICVRLVLHFLARGRDLEVPPEEAGKLYHSLMESVGTVLCRMGQVTAPDPATHAVPKYCTSQSRHGWGLIAALVAISALCGQHRQRCGSSLS